jgi:hypothetical protein
LININNKSVFIKEGGYVMQGRVERKSDHIPGVKCVVNTCYYHDAGDYCNASKIEIQPNNAVSTEETDCATFAPKH